MAGLAITLEPRPEMWTSDRRLYLTPDGAVSDQPVSGGRLLVPAGGELSSEDVARYGLTPAPEPTSAPKGRKGLEHKRLTDG